MLADGGGKCKEGARVPRRTIHVGCVEKLGITVWPCGTEEGDGEGGSEKGGPSSHGERVERDGRGCVLSQCAQSKRLLCVCVLPAFLSSTRGVRGTEEESGFMWVWR